MFPTPEGSKFSIRRAVAQLRRDIRAKKTQKKVMKERKK